LIGEISYTDYDAFNRLGVQVLLGLEIANKRYNNAQ
jgi:hypothetical protein